MSQRLVILANPLDRKEGWVKNHVNETLQKLGAAQDVEALEFSEELARCREKAAFKALLPKERERLAKELQGRDVLLFAPGSTASHLSVGRVRQDKHICGYVEDSLLGPQVLVSYSPSILKDSDRPNYRGVWERHLWKAWMLATSRAPEFRWPRVVTLEADGEAAVLKALESLDGTETLGVDVETPKVGQTTFFQDIERLLNVGFGSVELDLACSVTWYNASPRVRLRAAELLANQAKKVMHNGSFDMAVFKHHKLPVARWDLDTMEIWRFLFPRLPMSLAYVAGFLTFCPDWKDEWKTSGKKKHEADIIADFAAKTTEAGIERVLALGGRSEFDGIRKHWERLKPRGGVETADGPNSGRPGAGPQVPSSGLLQPGASRAGNARRELLAWCAGKAKRGEAVFDTFLENLWAEQQKNSEDPVCKPYSDQQLSFREVFSGDASEDLFLTGDSGERSLYNARDSWLQDLCWKRLEPVVERRHRGPEQVELLGKCLNIGVKMFVKGVPVSQKGVESWRVPLKEKAVTYRQQLLEKVQKATLWDTSLGEFNPNKPAHIRWIFAQLGVPSPKKTAKGADSFDAEALVKLKEHPAPTVAELAAAILLEREPKKLLSTYIEGLPVHPDGKVHPRWNPLGTLTGRWTSKDPNGQNIPDYLYNIFEVEPGLWWVKVDQSQLELRIAAFFSGEQNLIQAYLDGADVHSMNARVFFGLPPGAKVTKPMRQFAKGGAYGLGYGAADKTVLARMKENEAIPKEMRERIGLPEMANARLNYFKAYPGIKRRQEETLRFAMENRYMGEELSGRRVYFPGEVDVSVVYNFPIQTFAGFVMNEGIIELDAALDWEKEAILDQVHDSVTVCGPDPERLFQLLKRCFEREYTYRGRTMRFRIEGKYGQGQLSGGVAFDADAKVLPPWA